MSRMQIGNLNYSIKADTSQLNESATLTRQQMRDVRRVMEETKDPAHRLQEQIDRLTTIFQMGAITAEQYEAAVANVHARSPEGLEKARRLKEEEDRHNDTLREAKRLMQEVETEEEQRARRLDHLNDLLRRGYLTQDAYNRQLDRMSQRNVMGGIRDAARDLSGSLPGVSQATSAFAAAGGGPAAAALAVGLGAVIGAAAGAAYTIHKVSEQSEEIDRIADSAQKLGMSFGDLAVARASLGETSGLDEGAIDNSLQKMMVGLNEAAVTGEGGTHDALEKLGLEAAELLRKGPKEALKEIMRATQDLKNPNDQLLVSYELFGKAGAALVNSLREGPEAVEEMDKWFEKTGMKLTEAQAQAVGNANDAWGKMQMMGTGVFRQLAAESAPVFEAIAHYVMGYADEFAEFNRSLPSIIDHTAQFAGWLYDGYEVVDLTRKTLWNITQFDFSQIGTDMANALDFTSAQRFQNEIDNARARARATAREAEEKREQGKAAESFVQNLERQKAAEKKAREEKEAKEKEFADKKRQEQERLLKEREAKEREAEQERERRRKEAEEERARAFQEADKLLEKHKEGYALAKQMAELDDLRMKGMLNSRDHAMMKQKLIEDEASKDSRRAEAKTATRGSAEEYEILRTMQSQGVDKQLTEMREQKLLMKVNNEELKRLVRAVETGKKPMRIR